ncbi:MAG: hypothetical protein H6722_21930 [Sandaracinus sp.]|nr:hypothetical protein [Myxococcales bacterium]MCB9615107.1 hypothetical protein [Sandaracinus sp.]
MAGELDASSWATGLRVPRILWAALLGSCVVYAGLVASGMLVAGREEPIVLDVSMALVFVAGAIASGVASFVVPKILLTQALANATPPKIEEREDPSGQALFRDASARTAFFADPPAVRRLFLLRFHTALILSLALSEAVAIFGLAGHVAGMLPMPVALAFIGVGMLLQVLRFPHPARCEAICERTWGARWPAE